MSVGVRPRVRSPGLGRVSQAGPVGFDRAGGCSLALLWPLAVACVGRGISETLGAWGEGTSLPQSIGAFGSGDSWAQPPLALGQVRLPRLAGCGSRALRPGGVCAVPVCAQRDFTVAQAPPVRAGPGKRPAGWTRLPGAAAAGQCRLSFRCGARSPSRVPTLASCPPLTPHAPGPPSRPHPPPAGHPLSGSGPLSSEASVTVARGRGR